MGPLARTMEPQARYFVQHGCGDDARPIRANDRAVTRNVYADASAVLKPRDRSAGADDACRAGEDAHVG